MSGDIEAAGRGMRRRIELEDGWHSVVVTLDEAGVITIETIPDEQTPPHKTKAARENLYRRIALGLFGGQL